MPDKYGFDHLPNWGAITYRCIECGEPDPPRSMSEEERAAHADAHVRSRKTEAKKRLKDAAAHARKMKRLADKENAKAYAND